MEAQTRKGSATASHYQTLGANPTASAAELRRAYLKRARLLHPDQFSDRPDAERAKAERKMQELNAAWTVLSDPERRRTYDLDLLRPTAQPTGPVTTSPTTDPYERTKPRAPRVATEEDMEIRGMAKVMTPKVLLAIFGVLATLVIAATIFTSGGDAGAPDRSAPPPLPTGTPIGCIDVVPVAVEVPCGGHDAVVWDIIEANESCEGGLDPFYRQGLGGLFCATLVE